MYICRLLNNILLTIYAISDIYTLDSYGRIKTYIESKSQKNLNQSPYITVLSGDFISPVKYTNVDGGITVINALDIVPIDIVSLGNHEFDIPINKLNHSLSLNSGTTFISTNIEHIANTVRYHIYSDTKLNLTIGFIGLCSTDFYNKFPIYVISDEKIIDTISHIKNKFNPNYIIGLTHGTLKEDINWLDKFVDIDLILGGHIHQYDFTKYAEKPILRTGENAESIYEISFYPNNTYSIDLIDIMNIIPDPEIIKLSVQGEKYFEIFNNQILFYFTKSFSNYNPRKTQESIPKLICGLVTEYFSSNLTIINGGQFKLKNKNIIGNFSVGDFKELMPYNDFIVIIQIEPKDLIDSIEYSHTEHYGKGGYLQTDNIDLINNIESNYNQYSNTKIYLSTSTMLLDGIDPNPFLQKYRVKNKYDGIPIHNIVLSYSNRQF